MTDDQICAIWNRTQDPVACGRAIIAALAASSAVQPVNHEDDIEALIACLGDDAAQIRNEYNRSPNEVPEEWADTMDEAAATIQSLCKQLDDARGVQGSSPGHLMSTRGYHALVTVCYELRQDGQYSDDEGEDTAALEDLVRAIENTRIDRDSLEALRGEILALPYITPFPDGSSTNGELRTYRLGHRDGLRDAAQHVVAWSHRALSAPAVQPQGQALAEMRRAFVARSSGYGKGLDGNGSPGENAAAQEAFRNFVKGVQAFAHPPSPAAGQAVRMLSAAKEFIEAYDSEPGATRAMNCGLAVASIRAALAAEELMESGQTGTDGSQAPNDADAIRSAKAGSLTEGGKGASGEAVEVLRALIEVLDDEPRLFANNRSKWLMRLNAIQARAREVVAAQGGVGSADHG